MVQAVERVRWHHMEKMFIPDLKTVDWIRGHVGALTW